MSIIETLRAEQAERSRTWRHGRKRYWNEEELTPCGEPGLRPIWTRTFEPLDDCLVSRPKPFLLVIWEPLPTKAPGPHLAQPYCCYINTVIFYASPYRPRGHGHPYKIAGKWGFEKRRDLFAEFDQIQTRLHADDIVEFQGAQFDVGCSSVRWANKRWWMCSTARRRTK